MSEVEIVKLLGEDDRLAVARLCDSCVRRITVRGKDLVVLDIDEAPFKIVAIHAPTVVGS